jgi:hypothetical protein
MTRINLVAPTATAREGRRNRCRFSFQDGDGVFQLCALHVHRLSLRLCLIEQGFGLLSACGVPPSFNCGGAGTTGLWYFGQTLDSSSARRLNRDAGEALFRAAGA